MWIFTSHSLVVYLCHSNLCLCVFQSLADRCKKIHAGDEVIQVNHQTVVRPTYFSQPSLFMCLYVCCLNLNFGCFLCSFFICTCLCKCLFNSCVIVVYTKKSLAQVVCMDAIPLHTLLYTHLLFSEPP